MAALAVRDLEILRGSASLLHAQLELVAIRVEHSELAEVPPHIPRAVKRFPAVGPNTLNDLIDITRRLEQQAQMVQVALALPGVVGIDV